MRKLFTSRISRAQISKLRSQLSMSRTSQGCSLIRSRELPGVTHEERVLGARTGLILWLPDIRDLQGPIECEKRLPDPSDRHHRSRPVLGDTRAHRVRALERRVEVTLIE